MGLLSSLNNAVTGMRVNQDSLSVVSRNVANSGTPGYHRQSINVVDHTDGGSSYARTHGVQRAFSESLQTYYTRQVSDTAHSSVQAGYLDQLQTYLGKPGSAQSLDTVFQTLQNSLQQLSTSPDSYTARVETVANAQAMAETLNRLSANIQGMRQETESQIASAVQSLNSQLGSLHEVNSRLLDIGMEEGSRATLLDQRDRLVAGIAEKIDVRAQYDTNGSVALSTRAGVSLLDGRASTFRFESAGNIAATSEINIDPALSKVGTLLITTPSGLTLDMVQHGIIQGGELGGLLTLRDKTLVEAQSQLDEIAAGLATAFGTNRVAGTPTTGDTGFTVPLANLAPGNDVLVNYADATGSKQLRLVNTVQPMDYTDASGVRVVGLDLTDPDIAGQLAGLGTELGLDFSGSTSAALSVVTASASVDVQAVTARPSAIANQGDGLGINLFLDGGKSFTNDLDGIPPQKTGLAARLTVNPGIVANADLLVQHETTTTLGDSARPDYLIAQLANMDFVSGGDPTGKTGRFQLSGNLSEIISQTISFQGNSIAQAITRRDDRMLTLDTVTAQMQEEYGVNIDEEMARLIELQNAYSANARVVSIVQELLNALLAI